MNFLKDVQWIIPNKVYFYRKYKNYNKINLMKLFD